MNLFRNIIMAFVALIVLGVAAPAFAKTNLETVACRDAGFAALPFSGTATEKEAYAKNLAIGTEVLVDGITVPLASGESLWSKCKTGLSPLEIANARISVLETENARLNGLAYHTVTDGASGLLVRVPWKTTATATAAALETAKVKNAADMKAASKADFWQYLAIVVLVIAFLIACFRTTIGDKLEDMDMALGRWLDRRAAAKARKNAKPAPVAPAGIDSLQSDNRSTHAPGQP